MHEAGAAVSSEAADTCSSAQASGWAGRRVLVTGAAGFIGSGLTTLLAGAGAHIWAGVFPEDPSSSDLGLPTQASRLGVDVRDKESISRAIAEAKPEIVFHLAAVGVTNTSVDAHDALEVNAGGTINLLEALQHQRVERVVLVGTSYEYGAGEAKEGLDPFSFYAASKAAAWAFGRAYWRMLGMPIVLARPAQVYGPGQPQHTLISAAVTSALAGSDFRMTMGEQRRDFVFVDDVARGLLALATAPGIEGKSLDLGTGTLSSVREVVERIWRITDAKGKPLVGALPSRPGEATEVLVDVETTTRLTGWRASITLQEGLRQVVQAAREEPSKRAVGK
jgi:UDP-glucose 4-epimerase